MADQSKRQLMLLIIVQTTTAFRGGIVSPILSLLVRNEGLSIAEIGLLGTIGMLGWLIFEPLMGVVADRISRKHMIIVAVVGSTFLYLMYPYASTFWHFALLSFGMSSVMSSYAISVKALTAELLPIQNRGKTYGRYLSVISGAGILAPLLGGFVTEAAGYSIPFYISAGVGILTLVAVLFMDDVSQQIETRENTRNGWRDLLSGSLLGIFCIRAFFMFNLVFRQSFLPIYLHESPNFNASEFQIGAYLSILSVSVTLSQTLLGEFNDKLGSIRMILLTVGGLGLSYLGLLYLGGLIPLYFLGVIQGILLAGADMSMMIHLMAIMPEGRTGMVMGLYSESENIGGMLASPAMGYLYDSLGAYISILVLIGVLMVSSGLSMVILKEKKS